MFVIEQGEVIYKLRCAKCGTAVVCFESEFIKDSEKDIPHVFCPNMHCRDHMLWDRCETHYCERVFYSSDNYQMWYDKLKAAEAIPGTNE